MALFKNKKKASQKLTASEKQRAKRLQRTIKPSTQNTIKYTSLFENGLMHIAEDIYSASFKLGDVDYITAMDDEKISIIETYVDAINTFEPGTNYQLTVINRRVSDEQANNIYYDMAGDGFDEYREEFNDMIKSRAAGDIKNFEIEKYITASVDAINPEHAKRQLDDTFQALKRQFQEAEISLEEMDGPARMNVFSHVLRKKAMPYNYKDLAISGLTTKSFIAPNRIQFFEDYMLIDNRFAKVVYIRQFPNWLTDRLIKNMTDTGVELVATIHAAPHEPSRVLKEIKDTETDIKADMIKSQIKGANRGVSGELTISGRNRELSEATEKWRSEITDNDQKVYKGLIAVYFEADSFENLQFNEQKLKKATSKLGVELDDCYYYQEEALNTILPIGLPFLDVKQSFMRNFTTFNVATQVPFTNNDLQSNSPKALYYGQNQLSNNIITLDRKADLNAANGVVLGSSGSGKSMTTKGTEIVPTRLKYPEDRIIILDPEDEYSDIGREFGAQMIDISVGSSSHLNLLDLPDVDKLDEEDSQDLIGEKANLMMGLFENILSHVTDNDISIIDRVTRLTYERFAGSDRTPTLKDWHQVLKEQPEEVAQDLALKAETYTIGSLGIFSNETNVDLKSSFVIFNLKKLSNKLKPFALMVINDYIWQQVVEAQGVLTTRVYFDEMQLLFDSESQAQFFTQLWSRIRKYGAIPTGITQNVETLTASHEGRKLLANSQFIILLKQAGTDLDALSQVLTIKLTDKQLSYVTKPKAKGTGLIIAGSKVVPFENPIPKESKLYKLIATDA